MTKSPIARKIASLVHQYELIAIYAFGSRAKEALARVQGEEAPSSPISSDLDIGVLPPRNRHLTIDDKVLIGLELEKLFNVPRVDVVVLPEAPPFLALEIIRGELLYASDEVKEAEYELFVLRRAGDLAPWERERRRMLRTGEAI
ncbi:MAG: nucleotidyltransferase domain-containing protein [Chloroflexota bacterium]|nr:nucleotidyltransferase domain-containing protein [Chloroflexota bacterium]